MNRRQRRGETKHGVTHIVITDHRSILRYASPISSAAQSAIAITSPPQKRRAGRCDCDKICCARGNRIPARSRPEQSVVRHGDQRLLHGFHKACQPARAGVALNGPGITPISIVAALNQITTRHSRLQRRYQSPCPVKSAFASTPVHHTTIGIMAILFSMESRGSGYSEHTSPAGHPRALRHHGLKWRAVFRGYSGRCLKSAYSLSGNSFSTASIISAK